MSEQQLELIRVQKAIAKNIKKLKTAQQAAVISEVHIEGYERQIDYQTLLYKDRINKLQLQINRAIENSKFLHSNLEGLLEEKEALHLELTEAANFGRVQCDYCHRWFSPQGVKRHMEACASKPEIKAEKKHQKEVKAAKKDLIARKAAIKKIPKKPDPKDSEIKNLKEQLETLKALKELDKEEKADIIEEPKEE